MRALSIRYIWVEQMRITSKSVFTVISVVLLSFVGLTQPAAATTYSCNNFASQLCAPITTVSLSLDSGKALVTNSSTTFLGKNVTKLNFSINAGVDNASKTATLQFFDISAGMKLLVRSNETSACAAGNTIQKECLITLGADGKNTFYLTLLNAEPGMHFQFKYVGPEAWTSATKSVTYSTDGKVPVTPEACAGNNTQICGPVTNVSFKAKSTKVKISKPDKSGNYKAKLVATNDLLYFTYKSSSAYAFKYIYVDFYNLTSGLGLQVDTSTNALGAGCDRTVAASRGCYMALDSKGSATFIVTLSANAVGKAFNFKLNGAGYTSKYVTVTLIKAKKK